MKCDISVAIIESPLQALSLNADLYNYGEVYCFFRKGVVSPELVKLMSKDDNSVSLLSFRGILRLINLCIINRVENLIIDPRNSYGILLYILLRPKIITFLDDGMFSVYFDQTGDVNVNVKGAYLKTLFVNYLSSKNIVERASLYDLPVTYNYKHIRRNQFPHFSPQLLKILGVNEKEITFEKNKGEKTLYYIQSSLNGWIDIEKEKEVYIKVCEFADIKNLQCVFVLHRLCNEKQFLKQFPFIKKSQILKIDVPVEAFFSILNPNDLIGFSITSSIYGLTNLYKENTFVHFYPELKCFYLNRHKLVNNFYRNVAISIRSEKFFQVSVNVK